MASPPGIEPGATLVGGECSHHFAIPAPLAIHLKSCPVYSLWQIYIFNSYIGLKKSQRLTILELKATTRHFFISSVQYVVRVGWLQVVKSKSEAIGTVNCMSLKVLLTK